MQPTKSTTMQPTKSEGPRSLFSLATSLPLGSNPLHEFYHSLLSDCDYPLLSKVLFLQLVTKENILLYSSRRAEVKEAWHGLNSKIKDGQQSILIIDNQTDVRELLDLKGERRVLLFDLGKICTSALNQLLNHPQHQLTLLAIEDEARPLRPELSDMFPLVFRDEEEQEQLGLVNALPGSQPFDREKFNAAAAVNFAYSLENKEHEAFFKTYLTMLKDKLHSRGLVLPHSRWKKMDKILHLIGVTRAEGVFKCLSPADCLMAPECLGRTPSQLEALARANEESLLELIPLYGIERWLKQADSHFWLPPSRKGYFLSLLHKLKTRPSFYYPVEKYPQAVSLCHEPRDPPASHCLHYRVKGADKKLMSDKYLPVNSHLAYRLSLKYRCKDSAVVHVGLACFDATKTLICPVQICRVEESAVTVESIEEDKIVIIPQDVPLLSSWSKGLAYQRCIGLYPQGDTNSSISSDLVLSPHSQPYSEDPAVGIYHSIRGDAIELTAEGVKELRLLRPLLVSGVSKVMNHYQGGTYSIGATFTDPQPEWKQVELAYKGAGRTNNGQQFLLGTAFVRVVLLLNYNSGHPAFNVASKEVEVDFREVDWTSL